MNVGELEDFVNEAMANGWPGNTVPRVDADFPGFSGGNYRRDAWRCLDVWAGATTDAGMLVVFLEDAPVWICAYRGGIFQGSQHVGESTIEENALFEFLIKALRSPQTAALKLRGPEDVTSENGRWRYQFALHGDVQSFVATERIYELEMLAYERILIGGCVGDGVAYGSQSFDCW